jgi:hypothetical protein
MDTKSSGILGVCFIIAALIVALVPRGALVPHQEVGRYQFERTSGVNCFVLDTKTGRLWQGFVSSNNNQAPTWQENRAPWLAETGGQ